MSNKRVKIIGFHLPDEPYGEFSNWYIAPFEYAGRMYCCIEQYMMVRKVALARRHDLCTEIMSTDDPAKIKDLAGKQNFPEFMDIKDIWDKNCRHIVQQGVYAKFRQNPKLCKKLLNTGNALLAECAGQDKVWGIGINLHNAAWKDVSNWTGNNYLGIVLMEVRDRLRKDIMLNGKVEYVDYSDSPEIDEWLMTPRELMRYPQYYKAVHSYADQLREPNEKEAFFDYLLTDTEYSMRVNMGGGLPADGFWEMKQDIYETAAFINPRKIRYEEIVKKIGEDILDLDVPDIENSKFEILCKYQLVDISQHNLSYVRQHYPSSITNFIESNVDKYVEIVAGTRANDSEILSAIESQSIDLENKKKLIGLVRKPISIKNTQYSIELEEYIIQNKLDIGDLAYLLKKYSDYSLETQDIIYENLKNNISILSENIVAFAENEALLFKIFADNNVAINNKANLLDLLITNEYSANLGLILQKMGFEYLAKLVNGEYRRSPRLLYNEETITILVILKKHGYISGYFVEAESNRIKVELK